MAANSFKTRLLVSVVLVSALLVLGIFGYRYWKPRRGVNDYEGCLGAGGQLVSSTVGLPANCTYEGKIYRTLR